MDNDMQHGFMNFSVEENILTIKGQGPWNLDAIDQRVIEAREHIEMVQGKPWAVLAIVSGDSILVPEAVAKLTKIIQSDQLKGRIATALVIQQCTIPELVETHLSQIYTLAGEEFKSFEEIVDAKNWLKLQLKYPLFIATLNDAG